MSMLIVLKKILLKEPTLHKYLATIILTGLLISLSTCNADPPSSAVMDDTGSFDYGTESDSARYYFLKGWEEILDNGRWTESEEAFRKAVDFDPEWLLGKSLVGRITRNLEERQQLWQELESAKDQAGAYERQLLDVNLLSLEAANNRDRGIKNSEEFAKRRSQLALTNFGAFARKYPGDSYFKAEYIEHLHHNYGPEAALDSLNALATDDQMDLGFYISYSASLELELGNLEKAKRLYEQLKETLNNPSFTSPLMLRAEIYLHQDSLEKAKEYVDRVVQMDPNHLIALSRQASIADRLNKE